MESYNAIIEKLNAYTKKHYQKLLVKGILLFLTLGFLFFLTITAIEYFLWLGSSGRLILLLFFVGIELYLLFKFILIPISFLFKVKRGLTNKEASTLIGRHFTSVGDKLINLLDLANNQDQTDLLVAAIDQRSAELKPIPFTDAVNMKEGLKPARYLVAPILIVLLILLTGNLNSFLGSYDRVVNYDVAYEPPAPFTFELLNTKLNVLEDETVVLSMTTLGSVRPEKVSIVINGRQLLMKEENGTFKHTLVPPLQTSSFYFLANDYNSRSYELIVGKVPTVSNFVMELRYPSYLNMRNETLKGSGNATVPEGTKIDWRVEGINTTAIQFKDGDSIYAFEENDGAFEYGRNIYNGLSYNITTSNENVKDYESLGFQIQVIKDEYPSLRVTQVLDSINPNVSYYSGWASDDNMLKKIRLVYYPESQKEKTRRLDLVQSSSNVEQFYYTFPSGIEVEEGKAYELYFEAIDNDGLRNGKITKSQLFRSKIYDDKELKDKELNTQKSVLKQMDKSLIKMEEQRQELKQLNDQQKEGKPLSYTDKTQLKNFLSKQKQQEELMQKFSQQLKEGLKKSDQDNERNKLLQERMERLEKEAERNKKLMEELSEIADKIDKEDLKKKLEELGKKQGNGQRNLEQILELTKRYYVAEKAAQLANELEQLSKKQTELSDTDKEEKKVSQVGQEKLNKDFDTIANELEELKKDNKDLKKPMDIDFNESLQERIKKDQSDALEELNKLEEEQKKDSEKEGAEKSAKKQKAAAQKMKELSEGLQKSASSAGGGGSAIAEDAEMLRQIMENLITFSFKQEELFESIERNGTDLAEFSGTVKKQKELRGLFEHVDDSLFSLSLRQVELAEYVNEQITEVYYNIDKSLESIAENQMYQGIAYQQYVLTASNNLADFLAKLLDNMQKSMMSGKGKGQGDGFQLPDIIKAQEELGEKMGEQGESGKEGNNGQQGQQGKNGNDGKSGKPGDDGKNGEGEKGENSGTGKNGQSGDESKGGKSGNGSNQKGKRGNGEGGKEGDTGNGEEGTNQGPSEQELQEIYEIYKEQQEIRLKLEEQLENLIKKEERDIAKKLVRQMEDFEDDLLENGITQRTISKVNVIQQQLMKLENAAMEQGEKMERESYEAKDDFRNPILTKPELLLKKSNDIEILNRQALPLRQNYQRRVKRYFKDEG